ncbi:hypothetical protein ACFUN8_28980 [Streptomyces sp. NPDC057307]|uniref:hypothetical protein n=1 Tax=Streptomyces sp. NPDC057307 TaxID=3346096 RepID=UPI0036456A94
MAEPTAAVHPPKDRGLVELEETIHNGGFWRLVPESVPRVYAKVDRKLLTHVEVCLRRLT